MTTKINPKVLLLLWTFLFLTGVESFSQTTIPDSTVVYGTWSLAGSPYLVQGEAIVPTDSTLIIEPGVTIKFKTGTNFDYTGGYDCGFLRVNGKLMAQGTASQRITFTRDGESGNWGIVYFSFLSNDSSIMKYCKVEYGYKMDNLLDFFGCSGALSFRASPKIVNCSISNNCLNGMNFYYFTAKN